MKNTNFELKDTELEEVNGGTFDDLILNPTRRSTSENYGEESNAYIVGFFPGLSGFP